MNPGLPGPHNEPLTLTVPKSQSVWTVARQYLQAQGLWGDIGAMTPLGGVRYNHDATYMTQEQNYTTSVPQGWVPIRYLQKLTPCD